ncbi:MAG: ribonuclease III [Holosporales bacterium]|nr:ribonuclease III [Holosporales bacterium]
MDKALRHTSLSDTDFDRLEFLGDRVLGLVIAKYVYSTTPGSAGDMAKKQAAFVSADACARAAVLYGLDKTLKTADKNLKQNRSVLADAMEAVLGATLLDFGYEEAEKLVMDLWQDIFNDYDETEQEYKTQLQELNQSLNGQRPVYEVLASSGPAHDPEFTVRVTALGRTASATGRSKKAAETAAAKLLLVNLK